MYSVYEILNVQYFLVGLTYIYYVNYVMNKLSMTWDKNAHSLTRALGKTAADKYIK